MVKLKPDEKEIWDKILKDLKVSRRKFILDILKGWLNNESDL